MKHFRCIICLILSLAFLGVVGAIENSKFDHLVGFFVGGVLLVSIVAVYWWGSNK